MELTDFYPARILPYREGVYEVFPELPSNAHWYAYWDGDKFCFRDRTIVGAFENRNRYTGAYRYAIWRGVKK